MKTKLKKVAALPKKFKDYYDLVYTRELAGKIKDQYNDFDDELFFQHIGKDLESLDFSQRLDLLSLSLKEAMSGIYADDVAIFTKVLGPKLKQDTGMFTYGWWLWPLGRYIELYSVKNIEDLELSLEFIEKLTQRFTGEFAIRGLLQFKPQRCLEKMLAWSVHPCVHVRRLSSEGIRIRLPWAKKLNLYADYSSECEKILNNLKQAPEKFIQKSVGNNLNDLYKEDYQLADSIVNNWISQSPSKHTLWIIKHGRRNLKKLSF